MKRCGVLLSPCFGALFVADLIVGKEELELQCRCRGRFNFRKIGIATIAVRMVHVGEGRWVVLRFPSIRVVHLLKESSRWEVERDLSLLLSRWPV